MTRTRQAGLFLGSVLVLTCCLAGCAGEEGALRFDGLYHSDVRTTGGVTYRRYLRFFEDGTVLSVSSSSEPAEVAAWLHAPQQNHGTWTREEGLLRFSCSSPTGTVDYEAEVLHDGLQVAFHSRINEQRGERRYAFFTLTGDAAAP